MRPRRRTDRAVGLPAAAEILRLPQEARAARGRKRKLFGIEAALAVILCVSLIKLWEPGAVFFAKALSRPYRAAAGFLTSLVPFSVTEALTVAAVLLAAAFLVSTLAALFRKRWKKLLNLALSIVLIVLSVVALYSVTAQFDYSRPEPVKPWISEDAGVEEYRDIVLRFARDAGALAASFPKDKNGISVAPSFAETAEKMRREVQKYAGGDYGYVAPLPKQVQNSWFLDLTGIVGVTFAPANEVNMNRNISELDLPYYMAHELGHSLGIMSEREANIFAAFVTLRSDDPWIRYSGYRMLINDLISPIRSLDLPEGYDGNARIAEVAARYGVPFDPKNDLWGEVLSEIDRRAGEDAKAVNNYIFGRGETEIAFYDALGADFSRDASVWPYAPDIPEWLSGALGFFNRIGAWFNDLYLKASGLSDGTGNYNTGGSEVVVPPENPDTGLPDGEPRIVYSETVKIFLWLDRNQT